MDEAPMEIERLKAECRRISDAFERADSDLRELKGSLDKVAEAKLELLSNRLSREIREDFWKSLKTGLYAAVLLGGVATIGGLLTLPDVLKSRVDAVVEGKQDEITKLRENLVESLITVKTNAKQAEQDVAALQAEVKAGNEQVNGLKKQVAQEADRAATAIGTDVKSFNVRLNQTQVALAETQRGLEEARAQASRLQGAVESAVQQSSATQQRLDVQTAQNALNRLGLCVGPADGHLGPATVAAIHSFQREHGLTETGALDQDTLKLIVTAAAIGYGAKASCN